MRSIELALEGGLRVLIAGLAFGAGLPVLFALAMRALTLGPTTTDADGRTRTATSPAGKAIAAVLIAVLVGGVVLGLSIIVASGMGKAVSFEHVIPVFVDKK